MKIGDKGKDQNMNRRQALIACGMMAGGFAGQFVHAKDEVSKSLFSDDPVFFNIEDYKSPTQLIFYFGDLTEFVLQKENGDQIIVPITEIWNALKEV